jgi:phage terminase large subunit-like protein
VKRKPGRPPAAWKSYAYGSEVDHFAEFCSTFLVQSIDEWDGEPLKLEPWQRRMMGEAMAYDEGGWPVWRSVVLILPRKNGKTMLLAAYAVYRLLTSEGSPEIVLAAASDKQAGRLFDAAATFCRRNDELADLVRIRDYVGEIVREDGGGRILRVASDSKTLHGYNPSLVVCDELAQWTTTTLRKAFEALTTGGGARKAPQVFTITTAGDARDREDSILGRMLDGAVSHGEVEERPGLTIARLPESQMLLYNYEAPTSDPRDTRAMKLANPASWITVAYLRKQAANPELSNAAVLQLHGCVWAAGEEHYLPDGAWRAVAAVRRVYEGEAITMAFDGSYSNDSTALVGCTLDGHVFVIGVWEKPEGDEEWKVPRAAVEVAVKKAFERWNVREFACDPPGWHREIEEWMETYSSPPVLEYPMSVRKMMSAACSRFYTAVVTGKLTHDGDGALARHLANAVVKETVDGAYITKERLSSPHKIDLAVAAVVAYDRAMRLDEWDGGLIERLA